MPFDNEDRPSASRPPPGKGAIFSTTPRLSDLDIERPQETPSRPEIPNQRLEIPSSQSHAALLEDHEILKAQVASLLRRQERDRLHRDQHAQRSQGASPPHQGPPDSMSRATFAEIAKYDGKGGTLRLRAFIHKLDSYFRYANTPKNLQLILAENKLTGTLETLWFSHQETIDDPSWESMKELLRLHFANDFETLEAHRKLRALRQTGTVQQYTAQFNTLAALLHDSVGDQALLLQYAENLSDVVRKSIATVPGNVGSLHSCQSAALQFDAFTRATTEKRPSALNTTASKGQGTAKTRGRGGNRGAKRGGDRKDRESQANRKPKYPCKFCRSADHFPSDCPLIPADLHAIARQNQTEHRHNQNTDRRQIEQHAGGAHAAPQDEAHHPPGQARALHAHARQVQGRTT